MMQLARMTIAVAGIHVAIGCGNDAGSPPDGAEVAVDAGPSDAMPTPDAEPAAAMIDCTAANGTCATIAIAGDAPAAGSARGFADPSMRAAPTGSRIWLAYSWPRVRSLPSGGGVVTVDSHLAHSDDGGATWAFDGPMWTSAAGTSAVDGAEGYFNQETVALAPDPSGAVWYSARLHYFTVASGPQVASFQIRVAKASSPAALATTTEQSLGGALTAPQWDTDVNLAALSSDLAGCTFNDPGVIVDGGSLYLAAECQLFTAGGEDAAHEFIALFATDPSGPVTGWEWSYLGKLADRADAVELGGENLLQAELGRGQDGALLLVASPSAPASPLATHYGCSAVEIAGLSPPALVRRPSGQLAVRATATASDLAPAGPGSCTYEPASSTGLVLVRRTLAPGVLDNVLVGTGLRP